MKRKKEDLTRIGRTTSEFSFKVLTKPQLSGLTVYYSVYHFCVNCELFMSSHFLINCRFLRGRCKNLDGSCPFSHKIDRDKVSDFLL